MKSENENTIIACMQKTWFATVIITGDKDFQAVKIERPEILAPAEFLAKY